MSDWVKLDPVALGEWLGAFSSSRERGEWAFGFQAGALGAMLRPGATKPEIDGHAKGALLRKEKEEDKNSISEKQRARVQARWNKHSAGDTGSIPRYGSGTEKNDTTELPREERRGDRSKDLPPTPPTGDETETPKGWETRLKDSQVQALYGAYPRKDGLGKSERRAIERALADTPFEALSEAAKAFAAAVARWPKEDRGFVPMCATWFNGRRWEADRSTWERGTPGAPGAPVVDRAAKARAALKGAKTWHSNCLARHGPESHHTTEAWSKVVAAQRDLEAVEQT